MVRGVKDQIVERLSLEVDNSLQYDAYQGIDQGFCFVDAEGFPHVGLCYSMLECCLPGCFLEGFRYTGFCSSLCISSLV
jgi:hypothetical protein